MISFALPFLTIAEQAVVRQPWQLLEEDGTAKELTGVLEGWDYNSNLSVCRDITVDLARAAASIEVPTDQLHLALIVRYGTGSGTLPRSIVGIQSHSLSVGHEQVRIRADLRGHDLSSRLHLESSLLLAGPVQGGPLSPRLVGSKLWKDVLDISLEGDDPQFPMEAISFKQQFRGRPEENALWYLHWTPALLRQEFTAGVCLYLNSDNETFITRITGHDASTLRGVLADVTAQMIAATIVQDAIEDRLDGYEADTVGAQVAHWIRRIFPGQSLRSVRELLLHRPAAFHAAIQSASDIEGALL